MKTLAYILYAFYVRIIVMYMDGKDISERLFRWADKKAGALEKKYPDFTDDIQS